MRQTSPSVAETNEGDGVRYGVGDGDDLDCIRWSTLNNPIFAPSGVGVQIACSSPRRSLAGSISRLVRRHTMHDDGGDLIPHSTAVSI